MIAAVLMTGDKTLRWSGGKPPFRTCELADVRRRGAGHNRVPSGAAPLGWTCALSKRGRYGGRSFWEFKRCSDGLQMDIHLPVGYIADSSNVNPTTGQI